MKVKLVVAEWIEKIKFQSYSDKENKQGQTFKTIYQQSESK